MHQNLTVSEPAAHEALRDLSSLESSIPGKLSRIATEANLLGKTQNEPNSHFLPLATALSYELAGGGGGGEEGPSTEPTSARVLGCCEGL